MFALAIAILRRKTVVIMPTTMAGAVILPFLPVLAVVLISSIASAHTSDFTMSSLSIADTDSIILAIIAGLLAMLVAQHIRASKEK